MSGVSDVGMRGLARRFGASLAFTEMVACEAYLDGETESNLRAEGRGVSPHAVQIVGRDPSAMARAASIGLSVRVSVGQALLKDCRMTDWKKLHGDAFANRRHIARIAE